MSTNFCYLCSLALTLLGCGANDQQTPGEETRSVSTPELATAVSDKQLNISILWDLSDRINDKVNPSSPAHSDKDIEVIHFLTEIFKQDMKKKGVYKAKAKIKVFFSPIPANDLINEIAKGLSYDLSGFTGDESSKNKKIVYDSITQIFTKNARKIYDLTMNGAKAGAWEGSDIWRFFKNNVKDYCVEKSADYRNILIILTDGYVYHKDSKDRMGNRTAYILPETLKGLRNKRDWLQIFQEKDYGLITTRTDLQNLEIMVLEITPSAGNKNDEDIIKEYLRKWFSEMGVKAENIACYNTDLPEYTKKKIAEFFNR